MSKKREEHEKTFARSDQSGVPPSLTHASEDVPVSLQTGCEHCDGYGAIFDTDDMEHNCPVCVGGSRQ